MDFNQVLFKDKTFSSLLEDIYKNANRKEKEIKALIDQLKPMIQEPGDAMMLVPLLKEYMELAIKNDDALIKMAGIVQRGMNNTGGNVLCTITLLLDTIIDITFNLNKYK